MQLENLKTVLKKNLTCMQQRYDAAIGGCCLMLLYHRVTNIDTDPQQLAVQPHLFDLQMDFLNKNYAVLSIDEIEWHINNRKKLPSNAISISFDDGYADNYIEALPILEKYRLPAVFYIATATINTSDEFWWDTVERIFLLGKTPSVLKYTLNGLDIDFTDFDKNSKRIYNQVLPMLRIMQPNARQEIIKQWQEIFNDFEPRASHRAVTFDELIQFAKSKYVTIGAHTHNHPSLAALDYTLQENEIAISNSILSKLLDNPINHFSFPFGTKVDYNADTIAICKQLKFKTVAANYPYIIHKKSDLFQLPRYLVRNWEIETFKKQLHYFAQPCR